VSLRFPKTAGIAATLAAAALVLTACGGQDASAGASGSEDGGLTGTVTADGSSTVAPLTEAAADLFRDIEPDINVTVATSGTGGGFQKFCAGETDISDASRPIKDEEAEVCKTAGIEFTELQVATDALTIAVHKDLGVDCLTVEQIGKLFGPESKITNWKDLDASFPDQKISFFFPGTDSGTYDYMAADVFENEAETLRTDVQASEDDNVLVQGVSGTEGAVGFFGYTYFEENADKLKAVEVDNGEGCVAPSVETAQAGEYAPLARPLFIYVANKKYTDNKAVAAYTDFYIENLETIAKAAKFIPLSDELYTTTKDALAGIA
jgi:phosphate transport system substrate-binding protein